jgi:glycerol-3-phosphate acyltransferase PlsY
MMYLASAVAAAYLVGSIPTGYIFCRILKKADIRALGSGNVGATNVFRTVGKIPGLMVFVLDFVKGTLAVTLMPAVTQKYFPGALSGYANAYVFLGGAVIAGHIWTCFLRFKGGKGVATTAGVMAGLSPMILLACLAIWIIVFMASKYVSLASISAAVSLPIFSLIFQKDLTFIVFTSVLCLVGVYAHRANIRRLLQGAENRAVKV